MKESRWTNKSSSDNEKHLTFIEREHACPLCGSTVELQIVKDNGPDLSLASLTEQAFCPCCKVKTRKKTYDIH